jgi:hypothetical protein
VAICDGYKVYDVLAREREGSDLTLAHCWAHVRRKFVEAIDRPEPGSALQLAVGVAFLAAVGWRRARR